MWAEPTAEEGVGRADGMLINVTKRGNGELSIHFHLVKNDRLKDFLKV